VRSCFSTIACNAALWDKGGTLWDGWLRLCEACGSRTSLFAAVHTSTPIAIGTAQDDSMLLRLRRTMPATALSTDRSAPLLRSTTHSDRSASLRDAPPRRRGRARAATLMQHRRAVAGLICFRVQVHIAKIEYILQTPGVAFLFGGKNRLD